MVNEVDIDKKIEELLYYKRGILTVKEYLNITSYNEIKRVKFVGDDNFFIETESGNKYEFKITKNKEWFTLYFIIFEFLHLYMP